MTRVAVLVAVAAGLLGLANGALADARYADPTGDAGSAPDISGIHVSNNAAGNITFEVATSYLEPTFDSGFVIAIDDDLDEEKVFNYVLFLDGEIQRTLLLAWVGYDYAEREPAFLRWRYGRGVWTVTVNRTDLGGLEAGGFVFWLFTQLYDADWNEIASDEAPDGAGVFEYELAPTANEVVVGAPVATPPKPLARRRFSVLAPVTFADGSVPLAGQVACQSRVGSTRIPSAGSLVAAPSSDARAARCVMRVPDGARGKALRVTVTVLVDGAGSSSRQFAWRIG